MKLKYFFPTFIAMLAMLVSCSDENEPTYLDGLQVSSSYVAIPVDGGKTTITLTATDSWELVADEIPAWLTVAPQSGAAGETAVTFSAEKTLDGRTAELHVKCANGEVQNINVIQGLATISPATCAEVIAGPDSKNYQVTGTVTRIANTSYGNFYLNDGTGEIYIYGTVDASGSYNWSKFGIEVGDEVTVAGPKTTYNGTVELVDATWIKTNKSLIKVAETDVENNELPLEGGDINVVLDNKGKNVSVEVPEDAKNWLSIAAINGNNVKFHAAANEGGDRSTTIVFKTTDGKKDYTAEMTLTQKGAIVACSVAEFNAAEVGTTVYRLTAVVTEVVDAAKGRFYIADYSGSTYVYNYSDFAAKEVKAGDVVTVVGKRDQYKETIEMTGGEIEEVKVVTPVSIEEFLAKEDNPNVLYMVTGTITEVANATYGNLYLNDGESTVYVYGCYPGWGATGDNRKNLLETAGIAVGDKLTVIGPKSTYKDVPQVNGGIYFSHEKAAE